VPVAFQVQGPDTFALTAGGRDAEESLLIDPVLHWATYAGGSAYEWAYAVARESDGSVVVAGETTSSDFPVTAGVFDPTYNGFGPPTSDVFVARIAPDGRSAIYATYLGGSSGDRPFGLAGNGQGEVVVVGNTMSANFPTTSGAYSRVLQGSSDVFVTRLNASGSALVFSTLLGGSDTETGEAVALDASGSAWVAGVTSSPTFPTTAGALQSARSGTSDAFVVRLAPDGGSLLASTLIGGSDGDVAKAVAVAPSGGVHVGGVTSSPNFPTTSGAAQRVLRGSSDAFLCHLSADLATLSMSTLIGGASGDVGEAVAAGVGGLPVLAGVTSSSDFPTTPGAFQRTARGSSDAFAAGFDAQGALRFATLVGGGNGDVAKGLAVDPAGTLLLGGQCSSSDFPTTPNAVMRSGAGSADAFLAHLAADGTGMLFGTMLGGSGSDGGEDCAGTAADAVALVGVTNSSNLPGTAGSWSSTQRGTNDGFAALLDARPMGVVRYGQGTPSCMGPVHVAVNRWPAAGAGDFALTCVGAPPLALGFLVVGFAPAPGIPVFGVLAWIDITQPVFSVTTFSDVAGFARVSVPLIGVAPGVTAYFQYAWLNPPGCGAPAGFSASDAVEVILQ
jgi:hypothetical protein